MSGDIVYVTPDQVAVSEDTSTQSTPIQQLPQYTSTYTAQPAQQPAAAVSPYASNPNPLQAPAYVYNPQAPAGAGYAQTSPYASTPASPYATSASKPAEAPKDVVYEVRLACLDLSEFVRMRGILRATEWLFALICFAVMTSQNSEEVQYNSYSQFRFLVGMAIMCWLWTLAMISIYCMREWQDRIPFFGLVEFGGDSFFTLLLFVAAIVAAQECNTDVEVFGGVLKACSLRAERIQAGVAFGFLTSFLMMYSIYYSFFNWRNGNKSGNGYRV